MKKIELCYTSNDQLWSIEDIAAEHGYTKTDDCYWAQIFKDADGNEIITSRENRVEIDPVAQLKAALNVSDNVPAKDELVQMLNAAPAKRIKLNGSWYGYCLVKMMDGIETSAICRTPIGGTLFRDTSIIYYTPEVRM